MSTPPLLRSRTLPPLLAPPTLLAPPSLAPLQSPPPPPPPSPPAPTSSSSPPHHPAPSPFAGAVARRLRSGRACDPCRRRKVRCDAVHPQCSNCRVASIGCVYSGSAAAAAATATASPPSALKHSTEDTLHFQGHFTVIQRCASLLPDWVAAHAQPALPITPTTELSAATAHTALVALCARFIHDAQLACALPNDFSWDALLRNDAGAIPPRAAECCASLACAVACTPDYFGLPPSAAASDMSRLLHAAFRTAADLAILGDDAPSPHIERALLTLTILALTYLVSGAPVKAARILSTARIRQDALATHSPLAHLLNATLNLGQWLAEWCIEAPLNASTPASAPPPLALPIASLQALAQHPRLPAPDHLHRLHAFCLASLASTCSWPPSYLQRQLLARACIALVVALRADPSAVHLLCQAGAHPCLANTAEGYILNVIASRLHGQPLTRWLSDTPRTLNVAQWRAFLNSP